MSGISPAPVKTQFPGLDNSLWGGISSVTEFGEIYMGPASVGRAHIYTNCTRFHFNKPLDIAGTRGKVYYQGNLDVLRADLHERVHVRCEFVTGVHGGAAVKDIWQVRDLNTIAENMGPESAQAALAANVITLNEPGKYRVWARVPAVRVDDHQARLVEGVSGTVVLYGSCVTTAYENACDSIIAGLIDVTAPTAYRVETRCKSNQGTYGLGRACAFGSPEIYSEIVFERVG